MQKTITVIPKQKSSTDQKIPVAVYCRVSTKSVNQSDSLENQIAHYTQTIGEDPRYDLVEIYYDFGISGYKENRPGFQRMMEDAEKGRFKLIITKAITRFARNTRTVLESTRRLKELRIGVFFELQGINTLSQEGELLMTLYAAFGQAESEGARLHTLMVLKRKYEEGRPPRRLERSMGYSKGKDGEYYPDEYAPLVLEIFEMAADGYTPSQITNYLNSETIRTHNGCCFNRKSVTRMLRNPAYKGDFIAQQFFVNEDRKLVKNMGEKPMYYIEDDHIPIVTTELWEKVQARLDSSTRKALPTKSRPTELTNQNYPYRNHLYCAGCGHRLIRSVRAGRVLWECDGKRRFTKEFCEGVCITDDEVREWEPIEDDIYISEIREKGKVLGHEFVDGEEWNQNHHKKIHISSAPELNEENYPYMNRIFCKYCGSRLRRIINKNNTVTWICDELSRKGRKGCRGVRIPDEKLQALRGIDYAVYIGKETIDGVTKFGYQRTRNTDASTQPEK